MGHFGLSPLGLVYLLLLFIPNIIWARRKPAGYESLVADEPRGLVLSERIGQVAVTTCALLFADFVIGPWTPWSWWLIASAITMLLYELAWLRYFIGGRTLRLFYGPLLGIPVPLASLPVLGFLLLGIYAKVIWMIAAVLLLGVGHIGIHLRHARTVGVR